MASSATSKVSERALDDRVSGDETAGLTRLPGAVRSSMLLPSSGSVAFDRTGHVAPPAVPKDRRIWTNVAKARQTGVSRLKSPDVSKNAEEHDLEV